MIGAKINIKPFSINDAWRGRRFKTPEFKEWGIHTFYVLPSALVVPQVDLYACVEWGVSSFLVDVDNPAKTFIDVLQKKYKFNDRKIIGLYLEKVKTEKGDEYIDFHFFENKKDLLIFLMSFT